LEEYKALFEEYGLFISFLISPQTSEKRIREVDENSSGFIYMVSSHAITGAKSAISKEQEEYFERVANMNLTHPRLIGFGISDAATFQLASRYSQGAIIGSAFINAIANSSDLNRDIQAFLGGVLAEN
jgi:tryptophan synthase alpha chain